MPRWMWLKSNLKWEKSIFSKFICRLVCHSGTFWGCYNLIYDFKYDISMAFEQYKSYFWAHIDGMLYFRNIIFGSFCSPYSL